MDTRHSYAIATPSYAGDLQRCALLCESIDRHVTGYGMHYLLIEDQDVALFKPLEKARRRVLAESDLLPRWLTARRDPFSLGRRRVWTGVEALRRRVPPLRGWHAQQLRKFALPLMIPEQVVLFADSDVIFLRPFDLAALDGEGGTRLFRQPNAITAAMRQHAGWYAAAGRIIGEPPPALPAFDYIAHLVSWRSRTVGALMEHVERVSGTDWVTAIARHRAMSEYLIYGLFVERVLGEARSGHRFVEQNLSRSFWSHAAIGQNGLSTLDGVLDRGHVAVGVQSFLGLPVEHLRTLFRAGAAPAG